MAHCSDLNENPASNSTSSKSDGENHFDDFYSYDTDADRNFTDSPGDAPERIKNLLKELSIVDFLVMHRIKLEREGEK